MIETSIPSSLVYSHMAHKDSNQWEPQLFSLKLHTQTIIDIKGIKKLYSVIPTCKQTFREPNIIHRQNMSNSNNSSVVYNGVDLYGNNNGVDLFPGWLWTWVKIYMETIMQGFSYNGLEACSYNNSNETFWHRWVNKN